MNAYSRISLNLFLPPVVAPSLLLAWAYIGATEKSTDTVSDDIAFCVFALVVGGVLTIIPSAVHTAIMEGFYRINALPIQKKSILVSSMSGSFSGALTLPIKAAAFDGFGPNIMSDFGFYSLLGILTGAITGYVIYSLANKNEN